MKICGDYHTHTFASDGRMNVNALARRATDVGLLEVAVTDHSFASTIFHMTRRKWQKQKAQIARVESNVKVLHGIEANLVNQKGDIDVPSDVICDCDVLVVGFHRYIGFCGERRGGYDRKWLFQNGFCGLDARQKLVEANTAAYVEAMDKFPIDVISHLNHRALVDVGKVCKKAKENGVFVELNEKHLDAIEKYADVMVESGVNFIVGTDAHGKKKVGKTDKIANFVGKYNIPPERVFGVDGNMPVFKDKKEFQRG